MLAKLSVIRNFLFPKIEISKKDKKVTINLRGHLFGLPVATRTTLGGVIVGANLTIDSNGVLNASGGSGGGGGEGAIWGVNITGNIDEQDDLNVALNLKAPKASPTFTGNVTMPGTGIWNSSGNVGVGTATPSEKVEVAGGLKYQTTDFLSGFAGAGTVLKKESDKWKMELDELIVRGSMSVYEMLIKKIRAIGGSFWVSESHVIHSVVETGMDEYTVTIDGADGTIPIEFQEWDFVMCQTWTGSGIKSYIAFVASVGTDTFDIIISSGSGVPAAGDSLVRIGNSSNDSRQGALYLTSSDTNAPYLDVLNGVYDGVISGRTKVRLGKLTGITDAAFGGALSGYGLYAETAYIKGAIVALSGEIGGWVIDSDSIYTGVKSLADGYNNESGGGITLGADGSIHTPNFYMNTDGTIGMREASIESSEQSVTGGTAKVKIEGSEISHVYTTGGGGGASTPTMYINVSDNDLYGAHLELGAGRGESVIGIYAGLVLINYDLETKAGRVMKVLRTTDASLNLTDAHHIVIGTRTATGNQTFNLPTSEFRDVGRHYIFKRGDTRNITLDAGSGNSIRTTHGGAGRTYDITGHGNTVELIWDGVEWAMLSRVPY
jgi:hypothetical protein